MDRIVAPIKAQDKGPAVANLQQAMLFIVEKRQLSPGNQTIVQWQQALAPELAQQLFGQQTLQLLLALSAALPLPGSEFVTPPVADALNKVLDDLGAFAPVPPPPPLPVEPSPSPVPPPLPFMKWEYKAYSWKQPSGMKSAGAIPDEITAALNKLGNEGWEAVSVFPIAMGGGATNMVGVLLRRVVPERGGNAEHPDRSTAIISLLGVPTPGAAVVTTDIQPVEQPARKSGCLSMVWTGLMKLIGIS